MGLLDFFSKKKNKVEQDEKKIAYDKSQNLNVIIDKFRSNEKEIHLKKVENEDYHRAINTIAGEIYTTEKINTSIKRSRNDDIILQLNLIQKKKYTEWTIDEIEILGEQDRKSVV